MGLPATPQVSAFLHFPSPVPDCTVPHSDTMDTFIVLVTYLLAYSACACVHVCSVQSLQSKDIPVSVDSMKFVSDKFVDTGLMRALCVSLICIVYWHSVCGKVRSLTLTVVLFQHQGKFSVKPE